MLWAGGVGSPTWVWVLIFGLVHGLAVALIGMPMMVRILPRSPQRQSGPKALMAILIVLALFGIAVALSYAALA